MIESATRGRKSLDKTAENVTVITAEEIRLTNAHTLADVLNTVPGVQVFLTGGPGSTALASIQDSENRHVAVYIDGVPLNNVSDNVTDVGALPVQNIAKIEVIKGPASSAWGSALGGVINIITKSGEGDRPSGTVSASYGSKETGDFRIATSGKQERVGYYFAAGRLQTDGFRPRNDFSGRSIYTKVSYDITNKTRVLFSVINYDLSRGTAEYPDYDLFINNASETHAATAAFQSSLNKEARLNVSIWGIRRIYRNDNYQLSTGAPLSVDNYKDTGYGTSVKLDWKHEQHDIVLGADFETKRLVSNTIAGSEQGLKKRAYFVNDTVSFERISVIPGVRYDQTDTNGNFTSPSLGMTYRVTDKTLLRAYAARGFNIPPLAATYGDNIFTVSNPDLKMEKVSSYQFGAESSALRHVWMKLSLFRHDISSVIENEALTPTTARAVNTGKGRRQGMEVEMKTAPIYHTSLVGGAAFMSSKDPDTGETILSVPQRTYDLGLQYVDDSVKALVQGHYIDWNADPSYGGQYGSFIVDLHVAKSLYVQNEQKLEAYGGVRNIFNGTQYLVDAYKNPGRWLEAGVRYQF